MDGQGTLRLEETSTGCSIDCVVIVAHALTEAAVDDAATAIALISAFDGGITSVTGDAAYGTIAFYGHGRWTGLLPLSVLPDTTATGVIDVHLGRARGTARSR